MTILRDIRVSFTPEDVLRAQRRNQHGIGVHLNAQCMLTPQKSITFIIGLGPDYASSHVGSVRKFRSLAESCWRRREELV
jgi:hypothetical protein